MKNYGLVFMLAFLAILTAGCSKQHESLNLLFFSELPTSAEEKASAITAEKTGEEHSAALEFYPFHHEKIVIELAGRNGDIFFVPEKDVKNLIDPVAFTPLTEAAETLDGISLEAFEGEDSDTGELQVYALPIGNDSYLFKELGFTLEEPLAAFIPAYSDNKEEAIELLQSLISQ